MSERGGSLGFVVGITSVAALGGLLFGYDTAVISGAIGFLQEHFELSPTMKGWTASSALVGCIVGVSVAGFLGVSDRFGRKRTLILAAIFFLISAIGTAFPRSLTEFIIFRIVGGVGVGIASMTSPMYIAEISPARMRGRLVSLNQLAIVFGVLVVYFVNYFIVLQGDEVWNRTVGWRWMFGSEAIPATSLLLLMFLVPESPRWLAKQGRSDEALSILIKIDGTDYAKQELAEINNVVRHESGSLSQPRGSDTLRGSNLLRDSNTLRDSSIFSPDLRMVLVIGVTLAVLQQITGINVVLYYAPEIFKSMGTDSNTAMLQTVAVGAVNLLFTLVAIWSVDKIGRKPLLLIGATGMGIGMFAIGFAAYFQNTSVWVLFFILGYIASFALALGPVVWVILSEIFPIRIRGRAMAIATLALWIACFAISQTFPMLHDNPYLVEKFHHGFSFWLYGVMCVVTIIFVARFVPETKGKSLEEIEQMWGKGSK